MEELIYMNASKIFSAISATTRTSISVAGAVPIGSVGVSVRFVNVGSEYQEVHYGKTGTIEDFPKHLNPNEAFDTEIALTYDRTIDYWLSVGSVDVWVVAYNSGSLVSSETVYSAPELISSMLRLITPANGERLVFSVSSDPTLSEVQNWIHEAEDYIDHKTGHAWRVVSISNEYHDTGDSIRLKHRSIRSMVSGVDKIEIWDGTSWIDYVATKTEDRASDFWIDYTNGIIYFVTSITFYKQGARISYRYGDTSVPKDIQEVATKLAARNI